MYRNIFQYFYCVNWSANADLILKQLKKVSKDNPNFMK
jgi:hypothetical protein